MEVWQSSLPSLFSELKVIKYSHFISWLQILFCSIYPGWSLSKREPDYPSDEDIAEYLAMVRDGYHAPAYSGPQQMEIGESQGSEILFINPQSLQNMESLQKMENRIKYQAGELGFDLVLKSYSFGVGKHMRYAERTDRIN